MSLKNRIARWLREPLVHFLIGGAALWLFLAWQGTPADPASRTIHITQEDRARMALQWQRMMQRPPTDAELDSLTQSWLREEVLYREALRLGLDRDDAVVRKRMANKMDMIAASMVEAETPDDATLEAWLTAHPHRFADDVRYSFDQLYFADKADAVAALASADPARLGQSLSVPGSVRGRDARLVEKDFGRAFLASLDGLKAGPQWQGPVASGYGWHLVRLNKRVTGAVPPLSTIRSRVETDWRAQTAGQRKDDAYALLRDAYDVTIER